MWLPSLVGKLNIDKMHSMGLKISAEQIYSINHSSLKDAVVILIAVPAQQKSYL